LPKTKYYRRKRLEKQAQEVTIIRDNWVYHIYGKTDADAAVGLLYANVNDFKRVELNYIEKIRTTENQRESVCITI
jgi:acyl-homoserine lactone acylase PvdQ